MSLLAQIQRKAVLAVTAFALASCGGPDNNPGATDAATADSPLGGGADANLSCPRIRVTAAQTLNVRSEPRAAAEMVGALNRGQIVAVINQVVGEDVNGTTTWYEIDSGAVRGFVTGAFAECTTDEPGRFPANAFLLPIECNKTVRISQGNNGGTSHTGRTQYAFDFAIPLNTPLLAMQEGTVAAIFNETGPGDQCYNGGPSSCFPFANYVLLMHPDGTTSIYKHLNRVDVAVGAAVTRGTVVGLSGSTGYSTGPHAHVMRQEVCASANCQSLPLSFADVDGTGVPSAGDNVTSQNCGD
jgi:Peptidase family M23/Bacterial SH3 domain